jgi:SAM-dependent methyltransferase
VQRWGSLVARGATVLDVACGSGRHLRWFAERGAKVTGVDRDAQATEPLRALGRIVVADIETGAWPFDGEQFGAVVVTNYLWRPLLPTLLASVAAGGLLIYETFALGNQTVGKPSNPDFLLKPGELLAAAQGLRVLGYEDGFLDQPPRFVQRVAAVRERSAGGDPVRYPLHAAG